MEISTTMCIPNDIIVEILLKVPANSLQRFRWACKYWFDLISRNPDFVKMHFHHSTTTRHESHDSSVLISTREKKIDLQCYLNYTTCSFSHPKRIVSQVPFEYFDRKTDVITSINGLLFWYKHDQRRYCIWNPCTNEYRMLQDPPIDESSSLFHYGFGYDHIIDDYKVVIIEFKGYYLDSNVYIYTVGTNSWRCIRPISRNLQPQLSKKDLVFVNGALCWVALCGTSIISFDIGKEKYKQMLIEPPGWHFTSRRYLPDVHPFEESLCIWQFKNLHAFEDSLCLEVLTRRPPAQKLQSYPEMWMLSYDQYDLNKEYRWTKLFKLEPPTTYTLSLKPLTLTKNGEILMLHGTRNLLSYDPKTNTFVLVDRIFGEERNRWHDVQAIYIESLVSLNSGTYFAALEA